MIEAELKARLSDPDEVRRRLDGLALGVVEEYRDVYFDTINGDLERDGRELRLRTIVGENGQARHVVTRKGSPVDAASGSKPESEHEVPDETIAAAELFAEGYVPVLGFTKRCVNYRFTVDGRGFLATVVTVPELEGVFLEVETMADDAGLAEALNAVRDVMAQLGVDQAQITTDTYTDAVRAARSV